MKSLSWGFFLHVCWEEFLLLFTEDSGDEQEMWGEHIGEWHAVKACWLDRLHLAVMRFYPSGMYPKHLAIGLT